MFEGERTESLISACAESLLSAYRKFTFCFWGSVQKIYFSVCVLCQAAAVLDEVSSAVQDDDPSFIVLTETKFSKVCVCVFGGGGGDRSK